MSETTEKTKPSGITVLLVDDDPTISEVVAKRLGMNGHTVHSVINPSEVLFKTEQLSPDIIILDLMMARMAGEEVLKKLKQTEFSKDIPVIVFSNKDTEEDMGYLYELGAAKFLMKASTSLQTLAETVESLVKGK